MKTLYYFFLVSLVIFFSILILGHFNILLPSWVRFYVNDFLCMPVVLTICLKVTHYLKKDSSIRLPLSLILLLTAFYSLYFEWYLPGVEPRYTGDWWDVVLYIAGSLVFFFLQFKK
ncbi:hypothetical protein BH23BAC2_BH23BAC2_10860 [soil metagenome]